MKKLIMFSVMLFFAFSLTACNCNDKATNTDSSVPCETTNNHTDENDNQCSNSCTNTTSEQTEAEVDHSHE